MLAAEGFEPDCPDRGRMRAKSWLDLSLLAIAVFSMATARYW